MRFYSTAIAIASLLGAGSSQAECLTNEDGFTIISGEYVCTISCPAGGNVQGKNTYVSQNGGALTLVNEAGQTTSGTISGLSGNSSSWGAFTAKNNCREIIFSNSTIWIKK